MLRELLKEEGPHELQVIAHLRTSCLSRLFVSEFLSSSYCATKQGLPSNGKGLLWTWRHSKRLLIDFGLSRLYDLANEP